MKASVGTGQRLRLLLVIGTRPEAIKMAPVVRACQARTDVLDPIVCFTGQHREMLAQVADYFEIRPDLNLDVMRPNQSLAGLTARCIEGLDEAMRTYAPDCVVAQGDTTTVLGASMVAFYHRKPFVHVEAGLRTGDLYAPWPEEFNRRLTGITAALHCAPTQRAADNLLAERVDPKTVEVTGNTVVDALLWTVERERQRDPHWRAKYQMLGERRMVLITGHRRENFGANFESICAALARLAGSHPDVELVYPVHLNPNVREPVYRILGKHANIRLVEPVAYPEFVWLMDRSSLILTDSGGVQEEAPSLRKPVLVMRETTERPEAVEAGVAQLVGSDENAIVAEATRILARGAADEVGTAPQNPYGDGTSARAIVERIVRDFHRFDAGRKAA